MVEIFCDGGCHGNGQETNIGGNGFVVLVNKEYFTHETEVIRNTTNNRQELQALINSIKWLNVVKHGKQVVIYSDSQYVVKGITIWSKKWNKNNWKRGKKLNQDVINSDLWKELFNLYNEKKPLVQWVKGHSTSEWNIFIDKEIQKDISFG